MASREVGRYTIEGQWTCPICKTVNKGRNSICISCATPRGGTKVNLPTNPQKAPRMTREEFRRLSDEASIGGKTPKSGDYTPKPNVRNSSDTSDWICEYCGRQNGSWHESCQGCGAPRNVNMPTYREITDFSRRSGISREEATEHLTSLSSSSGSSSEKTDFDTHYSELSSNQVLTGKEPLSSDSTESKTGDSNLLSRIQQKAEQFFLNTLEFISNYGKTLLAQIAIFAFIGAIIWVFTPHPKEITPTGFDWQREIRVSHLETVKENGWTVPDGGRVYDERLEHHHDERIHDGWHNETYIEYETQKTGTRTRTEYVDNGDGSYDVVTYEDDVFERVPVEKTRRVEDYHFEPRYQIKYYYEIERWRYFRSVTTTGNDQHPFWGDAILSGPTGQYGTGKEREEERIERYGVTCKVDGKDEQHYEVDNFSLWKELELGGKRTVMIRLGKIVEIKESR